MSRTVISTRFHVAVAPEVTFDRLIDVRTGVYSQLIAHSGVEQTPPGPIGPGTEFHVSRHRRPWMVIRVVEAMRPLRFRTEATVGSRWPGTADFNFERTEDGTLVDIESSVGPIRRWWLRPLGSIFVLVTRPWYVRKARENAVVIARELESQPNPDHVS